MYKIFNSSTTNNKVLFLHGFNSNSKFVLPLLNTNPNFEIISFDFPGCGSNKNVDHISIKTYSDYAVKILEEINEPVILVGHSLGGAVANVIANHPLVQKTVLLAPFNPFVVNNFTILREWLLPSNFNQAIDSLKHLVFNTDKTLYFNNIERSATTFLRETTSKHNIFKHVVDFEILNQNYIDHELMNYYASNKKNNINSRNRGLFYYSW